LRKDVFFIIFSFRMANFLTRRILLVVYVSINQKIRMMLILMVQEEPL
ncbi:hypothetical protein AM593_02638, partial [Mytilus galloprovincialis]